MAARFFRSFSKRAALCSALCSLLLWQSVADGATSLERNGYTYRYLGDDMEGDWQEANDMCPEGLLWIEDMAEVNWVESSFPARYLWLAAKAGDSAWANGKPFPSDVEMGSRPPPQCDCCAYLYVYSRTITWPACTANNQVICKAPTPPCKRFGTALHASSLAANRRQTGAELQRLSEPSVISCSARCLAAASCCAFEFHAPSGRCRLFAEAREDLWIPEEGAVIYEVGP